jgi:DNA ligase-1
MRLADLVETSIRVACTRSRLEKVGRIADLLRRLADDEVMPAVSYLVGSLPQGRIGFGPAALRQARPETAAAEPSLDVLTVDRRLKEIAGLSGPGSSRERGRFVRDLLRQATADEQSFLVRLFLGELRQGALEGLMAEALASAAEIPAGDVRRALMLAGDLPAVARAALVDGAPGLSRFRLELFRPLQPMLAQPAEDIAAAFERLGRAAVEVKLDGARVQVHKAGDDVRVFSRRLNDVTPAVPEVVETVRALGARELLLDGEVLALGSAGEPQPFQVTMRRFGRRLEVERLRSELPLTPFFFDLLQLDGRELIDLPAAERFAALEAVLHDLVVPRLVTEDRAEAEAFLRDTLEGGHEGVMVKALDSGYEAGSRGFAWLKVKPAHTLDLVVLAAEWGSGRRRGWLSNLHLGARDPAGGAFVMLGKTFKGMTDEMLTWQTVHLQRLEVARGEHVVYVRPELVVEVAFGDVQRSPRYPAGMALRFARVKRYRPDKSAAEADTIETVRAILARGRSGPSGDRCN